MKLFLLLFIFKTSWVLAISPSEFSSELLKDLNDDIKQDRYMKKERNPNRGPASITPEEGPDEEFKKQEYLKRNKVNGLLEKW